MPDIKTKDTIKGTIKTIDKAAIVSQKVKQAYVQTKDKAEHSTNTEESSPEEYAVNNAESHIKSATISAIYFGNKIGHKGYTETKANIPKVKSTIANAKDSFKTKRSMQSIKSRRSNNAIKTIDTTDKSIKQSVTSSGSKTIKQSEKLSTKAMGKSVKTAEQTFKTPIKTSAMPKAYPNNQITNTRKASEKITKTAKTVGGTTKKLAKATINTIKSIIASTKALVMAIVGGGWVAILGILVVVLLGSALSIFGGESHSSSYTPVNAQVESYDPIIRKYTKEHDIPEYVELVKAVMMQESGGYGNDPMQASECGFNTKYPNTLNGITDPEYSIDVGIQNLANCIGQAEVENPVDMEHIKLALQGYNYGNGYILWAKEKYGGYTIGNAMEFSDKKAQELG